MNEEPYLPPIFFDPLLEMINFGKEIVRIDRIAQIIDKTSWNVFQELVGTYEMSRLFFRKQAGLNFLKFPSATHNRFAHSIGCWMLGVKGLEDVTVCVYNKLESLQEWLIQQGKILEFLAALLLHDCGHGPFSHVLESNPLLNYSHEEIGAQIIRGDGPFAKEIQRRAGSIPTIHEILADFGLDYELIALMIIGEESDFKGSYSQFKAVRHLVEGDIDIDRLDHYQRDSFYMGTKLANFNISALFENIVLFPQADKCVRIRPQGIPHVMGLLHAKEMVFISSLDCTEIRSYESMLNLAVSSAIKKDALDAEEVPFLTEDELLYKLKQMDDEAVQIPLSHLLSRKPYQIVYKRSVGPTQRRQDIETRLSYLLKQKGLETYDLVVYVPFRSTPKGVDRWLNLCHINGQPFEELFEVGGFSYAMSSIAQKRQHEIRFYARNAKVAACIEDTLRQEFT